MRINDCSTERDTHTFQCPSCLQDVRPSAVACPVCGDDLSLLIALRTIIARLSPATASNEAHAPSTRDGIGSDE